jgi:hypothetical protein
MPGMESRSGPRLRGPRIVRNLAHSFRTHASANVPGSGDLGDLESIAVLQKGRYRMRKRHWMIAPTVVMAITACPVAGQDLSFLQPAFDLAVEAMERSHQATFGPRYVDAARIRTALGAAGLPIPSMSELEDAFNRPEKRQSVVDGTSAAVIIGSPDDPRLRAIDERRQRTIMGLRHEWSGNVRWVRDDGIVLGVWQIASLPEREGYGVVLRPVVTGPARYSAPPLLDGHMQIVIHVVREDGEWIAKLMSGS